MRSHRLFADSSLPAGGLRRAVGVLVLLALALGVFGISAARAEGREISPAEYDTYKAALLKAEKPGAVDTVLRRLMRTSRATHPNVYGKIVGPILKNSPY